MRNRNLRLAPTAAAAALILTACGDGAETQTADANLTAPEAGVAGAGGPDMVVIYPVGTAASLEPNAMRGEVERLQREQGGGAAQSGTAGQAGAAETSNQMAGATGNQAAGTQTGGQSAPQPGGGTSGSSAGAAGFTGLDRDGDGRLSPAEYAIHAIPGETPARQGATNDEKPPYVSDEALNQVVTSFRKLDTNGDFFLSDTEFKPNSR